MTARIILFLITIIFYSNSVIGQNNLSEIEKLSATGKIWGFLKYYHPNVADGKFDWDKELFRILPKVRASINKEEMSAVFIEWINNLGPIKQCKSCKKDEIDYFNKNFNLNWIQSPKLFSIQLSDKLKYIEENRHQGKKHYIAYFKGEPKIAFFKNEQDYPDFDWSNKNLRLLTLFRYWNMVEYFFPAKYQTDKNWNEVLNKLIPKFQNPKSKDEYHKVMVELIVSLDDSHALIYPNQEFCNFGCYNVPVEFKIIHDSIVITKFYDHELAKLNDLKIGDIITKINGQNIHQKFEVSRKYIHGSNISRKKINSGYYLLNGSTQSINVEVIRNGKTLSKNIKRYLFKNFKYDGNEQTEKYKLINDSIGYINIGKVDTKEVPKVMDALNNTKAIIFDLRKSKSSTPYFFANYITSQKKTFYKSVYPDLDYPGKFIWSEGGMSGNDKLKYNGNVILLVDENCQSQMEFTAMCLQVGDNVTTIGRQTSGANGNVIKFELVGGFKTQMSGIGIFYPNGKETQRDGVNVDIVVNPSIEVLSSGRDKILEKAIEFANK